MTVSRRDGRGGAQLVVTASLFRVRPQHLALKLPPGSGVREGDVVSLAEGGVIEIPQSVEPALAANIGALHLLIYGVIGAPHVVEDGFDSHFIEALRQGGGTLGGSSVENVTIDVTPRRRHSPPSSSELRLKAMNAAADLVLVPVYVASPRGDVIEVRVFDGRTGLSNGTTASPILPLPTVSWTAIGRRIGRLEIIGRFTGLNPAPTAAAFSQDGRVVVAVNGDLFFIDRDVSRLCGESLNPATQRRVSLRAGGRTWMIAAEKIGADEPGAGEDRVVIYDAGETVFRSGSYGRITGLASHDGDLAVLCGEELEILRLHGE